MGQCRKEIVDWVGREILPHEADLRAWIRRRGVSPDRIDDIVQETYCRIATLDSVAHIASGRGYFFQAARNIMAEQARRERIVRIETVTEIESLSIVWDEPSPERIVAGRQQWEIVRDLIAGLPERCRQVFELRRIHGFSQREIAAALNISENTVEVQLTRGIRKILEGLAGRDDMAEALKNERRRNRARH